MLLIEIETLSWRHSQFNEKDNEACLRCINDLVEEIWIEDITSNWFERLTQEGDSMLRKVVVQ